MQTDRGSGPAATIILISGVISLTSLLLFFGSALFTLQRAQAITDQAALEAGDAASGRIPGYPCDRAERLAINNEFQLADCDVRGLITRVTFQVTVLGISTQTRAKAGPQNQLR